MTKVGICVPTGGMVHAEFAFCFAAIAASAGVPLVLIHAESSLVQVNRNRGVQQARDAGCDRILFLDSDMTFPLDTLPRLLAHDKDIVGCLYARRVAPFDTLGDLLPGQTGVLQRASRLGGGCMLVRTSVYEKMRPPFYRTVAVEDVINPPAELAGCDLAGVASGDTYPEDFYFCGVARRLGLDVWADTALSLELGHTGHETHYLDRGANG